MEEETTLIEEQTTVIEEPVEEPALVADESEIVVEPVVDKPEYDAGSKYDEMFVMEDAAVENSAPEDVFYEEETGVIEEDPFYDAEEAEYQAEQLEE